MSGLEVIERGLRGLPISRVKKKRPGLNRVNADIS